MGELEKRINATLKQIAFINFYQQDFATQTIKNIVEEMRREFPLDLEWIPLIEELLKNAEARAKKLGGRVKMNEEKELLKIYKWFEKWFSEEEETS